LTAAHDLAQQCLRDLRALVAGLHPAVLGARGLTVAVEARASLLPISVLVDSDPRITDARFPLEVESAAFFVVSEALANVMKHSGSERARVVLAPLPTGGLRVAVADEGSGTASFAGSGLEGLRARVEAFGGRFTLQATPAVGTTVVAEFPVQQPAVAGV
jgi:signal transduction histidine kinase